MDELLTRALQSLPHGPEFRFLDRLASLNPGKSGSGEYAVRGDESFLRGHFPGEPMMPGVLLVEAAAQLAGIVAQSDPQVAPMAGLKLTSIRSAKIRGTARPGETIQLEAELLGRMGNLVQARALAHVNEQVVLEAEIVLSGEIA